MPTYDYRCYSCGNTQEEIHSITKDPIISCNNCAAKEPLSRMISDNPGGFVIKGDTSSKLYKESRLRVKKNADLELKQIERYGSGAQLVPNIAGVETDTWTEAQKLAKEAGIDTQTFDNHVETEKSISSEGKVDDRKWKKAKEAKHKA